MSQSKLSEMISSGAVKAVDVPKTGWTSIDPAVLGNPHPPDLKVWRAVGNEDVDFLVISAPGLHPVATMVSKDLTRRAPLPALIATCALAYATGAEPPHKATMTISDPSGGDAVGAVALPSHGWERFDVPQGTKPMDLPEGSVAWTAPGDEKYRFVAARVPGKPPMACMVENVTGKAQDVPPPIAALAVGLAERCCEPPVSAGVLTTDDVAGAMKLDAEIRRVMVASTIKPDVQCGVALALGISGLSHGIHLPRSSVFKIVAEAMERMEVPEEKCTDDRCGQVESIRAVLAGVNKTHAVAAMLDVLAEQLAPPDSQMEAAFSVLLAKVKAKRKQRLAVN